MKKIIFLAVILAIGMVSCHNRKEKEVCEEIKKEKVSEMFLFIDSCLADVPNAESNALIRNILVDTIKARIERKKGENFSLTQGSPLKIHSFEKYGALEPISGIITPCEFEKKNKGKYLLRFYNVTLTEELKNVKGLLLLYEVLAVVEESEVQKIKEDSTYNLQGRFIGSLGSIDRVDFALPNSSVREDPLSIEKGWGAYPNPSGGLKIDLGSFILEDVKIEPFVK